MDVPTVLRETKIGQKGFIKEDVMQYLDEFNSKIVSLENELKIAQESGPADPQEIVKYRNQVDSLQEKLNTSNNALRAAKTELEAAKKQHEQDQILIAQLKAQGGSAAPAQGVDSAELMAAKGEIAKLKSQLTATEQKLNTAEQKLASAPKTVAPAPVDNSAKDAEIAKIRGELTKINGELNSKKAELESKLREIADKDAKITQLTKDVQEKSDASAKKDEKITELNNEITNLKNTSTDPTLMMGTLFAEAQKTVNNLKKQAKEDADKVTKEANDKADKIISDANVEAAKAINSANLAAEVCIKEANEQAKLTVIEANTHADKVNEMSKTVRDLLRNEIESVNSKFADITSILNRLTNQASDRMNEAQLVIGEARKSVSDKNNVVKKLDAPTASFEAAKGPVVPENKQQTNYAKEKNVHNTPAYTNHNTNAQQNKNDNNNNKQQQQSKKAASFNFDMAELLKAAEEEAAKNPEE